MEDWSKYADIIDMEHPEPKTHPRMSAMDRAAQFAPFAALAGYDAMVAETSRLTDSQMDLDEEQMLALNETLEEIIGRSNEHPEVCITWFRKDGRKSGGAYVETVGRVREVVLAERYIILREGQRISLDDIKAITIK